MCTVLIKQKDEGLVNIVTLLISLIGAFATVYLAEADEQTKYVYFTQGLYVPYFYTKERGSC